MDQLSNMSISFVSYGLLRLNQVHISASRRRFKSVCCVESSRVQPLNSTLSVQNGKSFTLPEARKLIDSCGSELQNEFHKVDLATREHLRLLLESFRKHRVSTSHFLSTDGYGHSETGRETLDKIYADIFNCEAAAVRIQFFSGTHAIGCALFGILRPGDELISAAGAVYDTLQEVIGQPNNEEIEENMGTLKDWGVSYHCVPLDRDGNVDHKSLEETISERTRVVLVQRSFGYTWRKQLTNGDISEIIQTVRRCSHKAIVFVDNCYGEFVETMEPVDERIGADLMAGSLIKGIGGGLAPSGGYVAGRKELVDKALCRLAAPGVDGGATLGISRLLFQGLFQAPNVVGQTIKGGLLIARVMSTLGYDVNPKNEEWGFVRSVKVGSEDKVMKFCRAVQKNGPVGAFVEPVKGITPGYRDEVVFAQSTFIDGSSSELSADAPMREPYVVFAQGGMHWTHWALVLENVLMEIGPM